MRDLAKEGYVARNRLLDLERTYAQLSGAMSEDIGNLGRARRQVMRAICAAPASAGVPEGSAQPAVRRAEGSRIAGRRLEGQKFEVANVEVKAPVDGVVVGATCSPRAAWWRRASR
jgi:protease secretion system membrane fusion protein